MPTLKWIGKDKIINYHNEVPFRSLNEKREYSINGNETENLLIKGDNLEALKALLPYYYNRVKVIYIDPPYNTGNEKWIYNDNVNSPEIKKWLGKVVGGEAEDLSRHDKWLCMMMPRLRLLKELLSDDGVICISIDDTEFANIMHLMDEVFDERNKEEIICWRRRHNQPNDKSKAISKVAEFIVVYAKNLRYLKARRAFHGIPLTGNFTNPDNDPKGDWASKPWKAGSNQTGSRYTITTPTGKVLDEEWLGAEPTYRTYLAEGRMYFPRGGDGYPRKKYYKFEREDERQCAHNFWGHQDFGSNQEASEEIKAIGIEFDNPKPVRLINALLSIFSDKDSIIIDSFAGSGTTGHAVLQLNKQDGGKRKFILVELEDEIAERVTAQRLKRIIQGYSYRKTEGQKVKVEGLGGGFKFLKLGKPLFDKHKQIIGEPSYEDLAGYIYFTETHHTVDWGKANRDDWYVGENNGVRYFIIYGGKNELSEEFLEIARRYHGNKVVYADAVMIDDDELERFDIMFKQIPYEIRIF